MANNTEKTGWAKYCEEQNIAITGKRIFIDGLGGMAHGLFASLLIGCIIGTLGTYVPGLKSIIINPWHSEALAGANLLLASRTVLRLLQVGPAGVCLMLRVLVAGVGREIRAVVSLVKERDNGEAVQILAVYGKKAGV